MTNIQVLKSLITNIERSLTILGSPEFAQTNDLPGLQQDFKTLRIKFNELSRLTNRGRATAELRTDKLRKLKKWLDAYSQQREKTLESALPKKYHNKDLMIDASVLDQYHRYAIMALQYISNLTPRYQTLKERIDNILSVGKMLGTHLHKFELSEENLPTVDELSDDDGIEELNSDELEEDLDLSKVPTVVPAQMIKTIGALLKIYAKFIKKVEIKYDEIIPLIERLETVNLDELFPKINQRNTLIQSLFKNLVNVNKLLYQGKFHYSLAFRQKYYELIGECLTYLPDTLAAQVRTMLAQFQAKSPMEEAIDHSVGGIKEYDPIQDQSMMRASPFSQIPIPAKEIMDYSKPLPPPPKVPQFPLVTEPPSSGEKLKPEIGDKLSPEEKVKYEKLWQVASKFEVNQLLKIANNLNSKL